MTVQDYTAPYTVGRFMQDPSPVRLITGPVGSGKTSGCSIEIARLAAEMPPCKDGVRRSRILVARNTMPQLRSTTIKTFHSWFPPGVAGEWKLTEKTFYLYMQGVECEVMFRALDDAQDVANLLSLELSHAYLNEFREMHQDIMEGLSKRVGRYPAKRDCPQVWTPRIFGDSNMPVMGSYWYYMMEQLDPEEDPATQEHLPKPNGWAIFKQPGGRTPSAENVENLPPDYYKTEGLSREYIRVMIDAQYGTNLDGKPVWPQFDREIHVAKRVLAPNRGIPLLIGMDFGRTPAAVIGQLNLHGQLNVLDEIATRDCGAERFCTEYLKPLLTNKYDGIPLMIIGDPAGEAKSPTDDRSVADVLKAHFPKCYKSARTNALVPRLSAVEDRLLRLTDLGPALQISPNCTKLIAAMDGGYHYRVVKGIPQAEPVKNQHSHIADAKQYLALHCDTSTLSAAQRWRLERQRAGQRRVREYRPADQQMGY